MLGQVDRGGVDPQRPAQPEPGPVQQLPEPGNPMQPRPDLLAGRLDPEPAIGVQQAACRPGWPARRCPGTSPAPRATACIRSWAVNRSMRHLPSRACRSRRGSLRWVQPEPSGYCSPRPSARSMPMWANQTSASATATPDPLQDPDQPQGRPEEHRYGSGHRSPHRRACSTQDRAGQDPGPAAAPRTATTTAHTCRTAPPPWPATPRPRCATAPAASPVTTPAAAPASPVAVSEGCEGRRPAPRAARSLDAIAPHRSHESRLQRQLGCDASDRSGPKGLRRWAIGPSARGTCVTEIVGLGYSVAKASLAVAGCALAWAAVGRPGRRLCRRRAQLPWPLAAPAAHMNSITGAWIIELTAGPCCFLVAAGRCGASRGRSRTPRRPRTRSPAGR